MDLARPSCWRPASRINSVVWSLIQFFSVTKFRRGEFESLSPSTITVFFFLFFSCTVLILYSTVHQNFSWFHWNTLASPELHIQTWMLCMKAASMTVGISMDQEICLILGQVSPSLLDKVRNLQKDTCGLGRDCQNGKQHPGQIIYVQNFGKECQRTLTWLRSTIGQLKNQSSIMQEDYEESISLTLMTEFKEIWFPLCFARLARKPSMEKLVARLMVSSLSLHVYWKPVNPQDCVWKNLFRNITRTISQEKETIHYRTTIWHTNLFLCLKPWRYPQQKQRWVMEKIEKYSGVGQNKSQKQIRGDRWSKDEGRKVHFCLTDGHLSFAECRIGENTKNTKVELYSEVILWNMMMMDLTQYSLNKDHQHLKWRQQKS